MLLDIKEIFVFQFQKDLAEKVDKRDSSLRVIAIPEIPKFFRKPITLNRALYYYHAYIRRYGVPSSHHYKHSIDVGNVALCESCSSHIDSESSPTITEIMSRGWYILTFKLKINKGDKEREFKHFCSKKCISEYLEETNQSRRIQIHSSTSRKRLTFREVQKLSC